MKIFQILKEHYILTIILFIGIILRVYHIDFQSVWLDEIHTLNDANPSNSISEVYSSIVMADPHPPLYFYIIHILFKIFGYTPIVARMFSVLIGVLTIFYTYKLGKQMMNKEVGLISALLLAINGYTIYYSQEARPYALLCLVTVLSFYYLLKYIKLPTRKNAILYGVFGALMLYGHFFALFGLLSQLFILLFFLIISKKENRKALIINGLISGLIMTILFSPTYKIFIAATQIKDFWIPYPTADIYTLIYKEFFGNSEMILTILGIISLVYVIRISKEKPSDFSYNSIVGNKMILSFVILIPWIVIVILIPLIRSCLSIPMIISRYFINILPAILMLLSIGIYQFKNQIIKGSIIFLLFIFTLTDIIVVKKYYKNVNKTQFREATQFIINNNKNNEPVVTSLPWYFSYFLNNDEHNYTIVGKNLDEYVQEMVVDATKRKAFWYVDGHIRPYKVTEQTQHYLDANFVVENNVDLYDIWTKHYVISSNTVKKIDISKYKPLAERNGSSINFSIENFSKNENEVLISGWSYFNDQNAFNSKIDVVFIKDGIAYNLNTQRIKRDDVTSYFKSNYDIGNSGFSSKVNLKNLPRGKYTIGIFITDTTSKKEGLVLTDKIFEN